MVCYLLLLLTQLILFQWLLHVHWFGSPSKPLPSSVIVLIETTGKKQNPGLSEAYLSFYAFWKFILKNGVNKNIENYT